jgi:hypothetical protein
MLVWFANIREIRDNDDGRIAVSGIDEAPDREQALSGLLALYGEAVPGRISEEPNAGRRVATVGSYSEGKNADEDFDPGCTCCVMDSGFSVHAGLVSARTESGSGALDPVCGTTP